MDHPTLDGIPEPPAFRCTQCHMRTQTDDFSIIGRNCWITDFEKPHNMVTTQLIPTEPDEDYLKTSAEFGVSWLVEIAYNTDENGKWVANDMPWSDLPTTLHGPFVDEDEANAWIASYPDGDKDVNDMRTVVLNNVRPV